MLDGMGGLGKELSMTGRLTRDAICAPSDDIVAREA